MKRALLFILPLAIFAIAIPAQAQRKKEEPKFPDAIEAPKAKKPQTAQDLKKFQKPTDEREHAKHATVMVLMMHTQGDWEGTDQVFRAIGQGSGSILNNNGLILTNNHVVDMAHGKSREYRAWLNQNGLTRFNYNVITDAFTEDAICWPADLIYNVESIDLAILQLNKVNGEIPETPCYLQFMPDDLLKEGMTARVLGFPAGKVRKTPVVVTSGTITDLGRSPSGALNYIETDAECHSGNSGGPCVNEDWRIIGVVTHKIVEDKTRNITGVSPTYLVKRFVKSVFDKGLLKGRGVDLFPLADLFIDDDGTFEFPENSRSVPRILVEFNEGGKYQGSLPFEPTTETVTAKTYFGTIEIPYDFIAYMFARTSRSGTFFMEGGDRISFQLEDVVLTGKIGGSEGSFNLEDVKKITFPKSETRTLNVLNGDGVVIEGLGTRLSLSQLDGQVVIAGTPFSIPEISEIKVKKGGVRCFSIAGGTDLEGEIDPQKTVFANVPWSDKPIEINLAKAIPAKVRTVDWAYVNSFSRQLVNRFTIIDSDVTDIAKLLDRPEWKDAAGIFEEIDGKRFDSREDRDIVRALKAIYDLRDENWEEALLQFRRLKTNRIVGPTCWAFWEVMEEYKGKDFKFKGQSLSDPETFYRACVAIARERLEPLERQIDKLEDDIKKSEGKKRFNSTVKKLVDDLNVIDRMNVGCATTSIVRTLVLGRRSKVYEYFAKTDEMKEYKFKHDNAQNRQERNKWARKFNKTLKERNEVVDEYNDYDNQIRQYSRGFSLAPPDAGE